MTSGELGGGLGDELRSRAAEPALVAERVGLAVPEILDLTDRILEEPGRRSQLFTWLKRPGRGPADWLAVDAYYPGNKVVVVCRETAGPYRDLFTEAISARGLRLLEVDERELTRGREAAQRTLEDRIAQLGPVGSQTVGAPGGKRAPTRRHGARQAVGRPGSSSVALAHAAAAGQRQLTGRPAGDRQLTGVLAGFALIAVLVAEVFMGVARAGFDSGHVLFGFGLALDACARGLGTIAATREGASDWAWWCALGGSPVVAWFALFQTDGPVRTEPAPLAGLIAVLAMVVLAATLLAAVL